MADRSPDARTFGQDLMRGEGTNVLPGGARPAGPIPGGAGANTAWRGKGETPSLKGGLAFGTTAHPYDGNSSPAAATGTSIFDPVLAELAYRWFSPPGGLVVDPFAGGSVRGIVAARLGRRYIGVDLRPEQIAANEAQAGAICRPDDPAPDWRCGDSTDIAALLGPVQPDFIFSCPPYGDLERYSDDPRDLSTMDYPAFLASYRAIIGACSAMLAPDRFACFVVGDIRDGRGHYRGLPSHTIQAFQDAGLALYNEAVLITAVGSLPIRVVKQWTGARKLGRTHQSVLVFLKGDPRRASAAIGECEFGDIEAPGSDAADQPWGEPL